MSDRPQARRRLVHGRRVGHRLRGRQKQLVDELLPRLRVDLADGRSLDPEGLFGSAVEDIWLEIGFGGGEHLAFQAEANPAVGFIGCEPFVNGVAKLLAEIADRGIGNVRILDDDARGLLDRLADASIGRVFLLYPDPWPKKRHHKRRFLNAATVAQLARVLKDGGELRVSSDIPDYVRWTLRHVLAGGAFDWTAERPGDWQDRPADWPRTRYERKAVDAGRMPAYLIFRRRPRGA